LTGVFSPEEFLDSNEPVAAAFAAQLRELESLRACEESPTLERNDEPR
jgi:hypothetical protein